MQIIDSSKFHRASLIICVHRCIGKPIHLASHACQSSTAILRFAVRKSRFMSSAVGITWYWQQYPWYIMYILTSNTNKHCTG